MTFLPSCHQLEPCFPIEPTPGRVEKSGFRCRTSAKRRTDEPNTTKPCPRVSGVDQISIKEAPYFSARSPQDRMIYIYVYINMRLFAFAHHNIPPVLPHGNTHELQEASAVAAWRGRVTGSHGIPGSVHLPSRDLSATWPTRNVRGHTRERWEGPWHARGRPVRETPDGTFGIFIHFRLLYIYMILYVYNT